MGVPLFSETSHMLVPRRVNVPSHLWVTCNVDWSPQPKINESEEFPARLQMGRWCPACTQGKTWPIGIWLYKKDKLLHSWFSSWVTSLIQPSVIQYEYVEIHVIKRSVSEHSGVFPQIIHFNRVFHYKPSISGVRNTQYVVYQYRDDLCWFRISKSCVSPVGSAFLESKPTEKILQQKGSSWPTPDHGKDAPRGRCRPAASE